MCRALLYLGQPLLVNDILYEPDSSLIKQSYMPKMLQMLNLAGFGMLAWDRDSHAPEVPFRYASASVPIFDRNLKSLAGKIRASCLLAHVRGVSYSTEAVVSLQNTHPFAFDGVKLAMAHNGDLYRFGEMKAHLIGHIRPEIARCIAGSTDSEWIYALILSQLDDPAAAPGVDQIKRAVEGAFRIIRDVRQRLAIDTSSSVNLFLTDGSELVVVRFCFDFGCYRTASPELMQETNLSYLSLWYTTGREYGFHDGEWKMIGGADRADSIIVSSEPLTSDTSSWLEVPEYGLLYADTTSGRPKIETAYLDL